MKIRNNVSLFGLVMMVACSSAPHTDVAATPTDGAPPASVLPEPHFAEGNGAVVKVPIAGAVAVALDLAFYTGSVDDPPGKEGLTKLTATLMAQGGTERLTYPEMLRALYPMAASVAVQVDKEQTLFSTVVHTDHLEPIVGMLSEVVTAPRLAESDFKRVKQNLINDIEKRLRATDDENLGKEVLNLMMYDGAHPYRHFVGGTVAGLKSITLADVKAHFPKVFGKKRLVIGVGGAVDDAIVARIQAALAGLPEGVARLAKIPARKAPDAMQVVIAEKPSAQAIAISMGYPHFTRRGADGASALALVQSYFGEHRQFHGVLMGQMRGLRGLNYGDYAYVENFVQEGWSRFAATNVARRRQHFEIWIRPVAPDDAIFAVRLAMYFTDRLIRDGLTSKDVAGVNEFLQGYSRLWEMTPARRLGYAIDDHFYGTTKYLDQYRKDLATLTADQVNAAMRRYLIPSPMYIAIVAPDGAAMKEALVNPGTTVKTYSAKKPDEVLEMDKMVSTFPLGIAAENVRIVSVDELFEK